MVPAVRAPVPDSRRFRDRLSVAARLAAVVGAGGRRRSTRDRSLRRVADRPRNWQSAPSLARRRRQCPVSSPQQPPRGKSAAGVIRTALCVEARHGRVHVFMPPVRAHRGLPRSDCRPSSETAASADDAGHHRRDAARSRSAAQPPQGDAGSWRHRSQPASGAATGPSSFSRRRRSTRRRVQSRGSAPRSSCSTAVTPAPAGAITSCSAARRRPTAPSCAGRICCAACSATGTITRRCRFSSRASSSDRRASIRGSTKARSDSLHELEIAFAQVPEHRRISAVAGGSRVPASAGRRDRQHAPRRVLHRQALRAGNEQRPAGAGGAALVRDAAARADEPDAATAAARARRPLLEDPLQSVAGSLEHGAARSLHAAAFRGRRISATSSPICGRSGYAMQPQWFAPHLEFRFPVYGVGHAARRPRRTAAGARTVERARRGTRCRRRRALRGLVGRATTGEGDRHDGIAAFRRLQRPVGSAPSDGHGGRVRGRRALPRVAAAKLPASHHSGARAARLRSRRRVERAIARRLHVSRRAPGRAQLRDLSGQRVRSGRPPARAVLRTSVTHRDRWSSPPRSVTRTFP